MNEETTMLRRNCLTMLALPLVLPLVLHSAPALAQNFPERPIRILQGFAPGGNADNIARLVGAEMSKGLGQPMVIEAAPGAGGTIAATKVAAARPDGYTLLLATGGHAVAGALYNQLGYQTVAGFDMVSTITFFPFLIVARADGDIKGIADLLRAARAGADGITYGSAGVGSTQHLTGELLSSMTRTRLLHIPYRGDSAALTALMGGEVQFVVAPPTAVLPHVQSGRLRAIAATGPARWAGLPDLPTVAEQGVAGFDVRSWAGLMAPAGTPRPIVDRLNAELQKALKVEDVRHRLEGFGGEVRGGTPEEMHAMLTDQLNRWTQVVAEAGIPKQ
jgi:tripartite-type tricarboxylate transporter receptor subunit TctC